MIVLFKYVAFKVFHNIYYLGSKIKLCIQIELVALLYGTIESENAIQTLLLKIKEKRTILK